MADRRSHCCLIAGMAASFDIVFIDRFDLSTEAYQGYDGIPVDLIRNLNQIATEHVTITRRILLDVPINVAVERVMTRGEKLTVADVVRLEGVMARYSHMADMRRMYAINANQSPDQVFRDAVRLIEEVL